MTIPKPDRRVTAIVPMRHSSERIPYKNFADFRGKPLFCHILDSLLGASGVTTIVVDTDSPRVMDECDRRYPDVIVLERPESLRDGGIPMNDVLLHTVSQLEGDHFLQTHSTNPLLRSSTIDSAIIEYLDGLPEHDSLFGVTRWQTRLYDDQGAPINHDPALLARTQDLPPVFEENSNLYLFSRSTLETHRRRIGSSPRLFEIDRLEATDIDDTAGWRLAEAIAQAKLVEEPGS